MDKSENEGSKKIKERGREEREVGGGGIDTHFKIPAPNTTTEKGDLLALTLVWFKVGTGFIELDPEDPSHCSCDRHGPSWCWLGSVHRLSLCHLLGGL